MHKIQVKTKNMHNYRLKNDNYAYSSYDASGQNKRFDGYTYKKTAFVYFMSMKTAKLIFR